jgi:hypothetical protein
MSQIEDQILAELGSEGAALETIRQSGIEGAYAEILSAQHVDRIASLERQLEDVRFGLLEIVLNAGADEHLVSASVLSGVVGKLQKSLTWVAHALRSGPGVDREPPVEIRAMTGVQVEALAPGSFRIRLRRTPPRDSRQEQIASADLDLFELSVKSVLDLTAAAEQGLLGDEEESLAQSLGPKASRYLQGFITNVAESGGTTELLWASKAPRAVELSPERARALSDWLASVQSTTEVRDVIGVLLGADVESGRFKLRGDDGVTYEGKASPELVSHVETEARYEATVSVTLAQRQHIGTSVERYVLASLSRVTDEGT